MNYKLPITNKKAVFLSLGSWVLGFRFWGFRHPSSAFCLPSSAICLFSIIYFLFSFSSFSQVTTSIDLTTIKIGAQITYQIEVKTKPNNLVVFPEGQPFLPLEMMESYPIDTIKNNDTYNLIKKYGLTQFDSGKYTIPRQKIIVGDKTFFTDSLKVEVNNVVVDTTKQGLYDIKPIIEVDKKGSDWWKYVLLTLLIIGIIGFLMYWFIWRKKPLTEAEQIALLPPYDRAKLALKKLDESHYLETESIKEYYSELTFIIRKYLDEKVYDKALESTTDELINRLNLLKEGNQIELSTQDIKNLETILKRADLVKFAKSGVDKELAKIDRKTIDIEIDHVKEALPEPTEEEKLLDEQYREELARKNKRKKVIITVVIGVFLLVATFVGFGLKYGFNYVVDTVFGHDSIELLEGEWVTSDYGFPPVTISTPIVLTRTELPLPDALKEDVSQTTFLYGTLLDEFSVLVNTSTYKNLGENKIDLENVSEESLKAMEKQGAQNIVVFKEKFVTPHGAEGLKIYGSFVAKNTISQKIQACNYVLLLFTSENILQQIMVTNAKDDAYGNQIMERILNSVELKKAEE